MTGEGFSEKLNALRTLVDEGCGANMDLCQQHYTAGSKIVEELEHSQNLPAQARQMLPQIRRSLSDYYNILFNRSWTKRFLLDDIARLELLCLNPPSDEIQFPTQSFNPFDRSRDAA
ncbi:MAG TPA: hypothetical protein VGH19_13015 [Verrucomicrobiae bacterium]